MRKILKKFERFSFLMLTRKKRDIILSRNNREERIAGGERMEVTVGDFTLEWKRKDGKIHKADYDDLIKAYEKQEEYVKEIRNKVIEEMKELVRGHKYTNAEDGTTVEEMLKDKNTEKKYAWHLSRNQCCDWMLHRLDEIAEQMKEE